MQLNQNKISPTDSQASTCFSIMSQHIKKVRVFFSGGSQDVKSGKNDSYLLSRLNEHNLRKIWAVTESAQLENLPIQHLRRFNYEIEIRPHEPMGTHVIFVLLDDYRVSWNEEPWILCSTATLLLLSQIITKGILGAF